MPNFGYRKTIATTVTLAAGTNTIRFAKGTGYAELDFIEVKQ